MSAAKNNEQRDMLSATNGETIDELNGEMDDDDMDDGETGFATGVRR